MHDANNKRETSSASYSQDHLPHSLYSSLFIDLCEDVRVLEEVIFLINPASAHHQSIGRIAGRLSRTTVNRRSGSSDPCSVLRAQAPLTSSPTLIGFPPQPGNNTRSPG